MHFTGRQTASKITGKKKSRTCEAKDGTKRYQGSEVTLIDLRDEFVLGKGVKYNPELNECILQMEMNENQFVLRI